jgi:predicted membrane channel-forming protein YqfA (hemolysin III family)
MFEKSFLKSAGQLWKVWLSIALAVVAWVCVLVVLGGYVGDDPGRSMLIVVTGLFLAVGGFIWACRTVRCPACKARLLWMAASKQSHKTWLISLITQSQCPSCGAAGQKC